MMNRLIKKIFFKDANVKTFLITRLHEDEIAEEISLKKDGFVVDITGKQSMICLDPFCIAVWLPTSQLYQFDQQQVTIRFTKAKKLTASLRVTLIREMETATGALLLYKLDSVKNYQLNPIHRLALLAYLLRSKANTYYSRRVISALYSYPRKIIIVSYQDDEYYNIFPMDIQGYIAEEGLYILGLRTTNVTLNKILEARKVVICDTGNIDINTVYNLGKHSSTSPTKKEELPFAVNDSRVFGFPVPAIIGSYKEVEIINHKKMGYHMLLVGKVIHHEVVNPNTASLYHVGFLQSVNSGYSSIEATF